MPETDARVGMFPALLRHWRTRRGLSQLDLALVAGVSSRHISFLETGRSAPSAGMVLRLAEALDVPLRQRNAMLRAADHAPRYPERTADEPLPADLQLALDLMKRHHEPYPMLVIDRAYHVLDANLGAVALFSAVLPGGGALASSGVNLARFMFDPHGGVSVIDNFDAVARELLSRMQRELLEDPDNVALRSLLAELLASDHVDDDWREPDLSTPAAASLPLRVRVGGQLWSFVLMVTALQTPMDVTAEELRIEAWFPADEVTAAGCEALASAAGLRNT